MPTTLIKNQDNIKIQEQIKQIEENINATTFKGCTIEEFAILNPDIFLDRDDADHLLKLQKLSKETITFQTQQNKPSETNISQINNTYMDNKHSNLQSVQENIINKYNEFQRTGRISLSGITTKYKQLDDIIDGFQKGHLITVAGRTGMGKTWVALNLLKNIAIEQHIPSAIFSLEMSSSELLYRLISLCSGVSVKSMKQGKCSIEDIKKIEQAINIIDKAPIYILDDTNNSLLNDLDKNLRDLREKQEIAFAVIDHIGLMKVSNKQSENRANEVANITRKIKLSAKQMNIPILCLAQLNRKADQDEMPKLSDLKESGSIEQDSDIVIFIHRHNYFDSTKTDREAKIIVAKNRSGEQNITVIFEYNFNWVLSEKDALKEKEIKQKQQPQTDNKRSKARSKIDYSTAASGEKNEANEIQELYDKY